MIDYIKKFRLDGKNVIVSGGLGLLGKAIVIAFAQAGANVIVFDIDKKKGVEFEKECISKNLHIIFRLFDVTDINSYKNELNKVNDNFGPISILVNTAYPRTDDWGNKIKYITAESWEKNVNMNMNSYCLITKEMAEIMKRNKIKGNIINMGSIYGVVGPDFNVYEGTKMTCPAAYAAIKGGITNFTRYCASYYGKYNIRINTIAPGGIFDNQNPVFVENYNKKTPLKRMGNPEEVATATVFLASDAASYITGITLMVDGGWTCI